MIKTKLTFDEIVKIALNHDGLTLPSEISTSWTTGGMSGGSCWGDEADGPVEAEAEPEFEEFDKILETICPEITFIQYKKLVREVVELDYYRESEYYGNYYDKCKKVVKLAKLEQALKDRGLWQAK